MDNEKWGFRQIIIKNPYSFVYLCEGLAVSFVYLSGIGRFRFVIVYAIYLIVNSILSKNNSNKRIHYFILPLSIIAFYFDFKNGPLFPIFTQNYIFVSILFVIFIDSIAKKYALRFVVGLAGAAYFKICPKCKYENSELVSKCSQCAYESNEPFSLSQVQNSENKKIPLKVLRMIELSDDERIEFSIRLFPFISVTKNGNREIRTFLIITSEKIVFLDYFFFQESWREKDVIDLKDVVSMNLEMKKIYLTEEPFFEIVTSDGNVYEIIFKKIGKYKEHCEKIKNIIIKNREKKMKN